MVCRLGRTDTLQLHTSDGVRLRPKPPSAVFNRRLSLMEEVTEAKRCVLFAYDEVSEGAHSMCM
jgi:hypothetical protein